MTDRDNITLHKSDCALLLGGYQCTCGFHQRNSKTLAAEQPKQEAEALADRLDDERMNLIERLADENERLREALTYDWDQLEACRESLREHMVEIKRLREALHHISLCSQNSMSSKAECGRIARAALRWEVKP